MTIDEIAKRAGVSKSAVSRYLNHGYISEDKKEKIRIVIEQTGYMPSRQARQLRTGKTNLIGVILPKINSESISRIVAGISQVLNQKGYQILLANTDNNIEQELAYLNIFQREQVDGVILIATILTKKHERCIKSYPVPVVIIGQQASFASSVYHDDFGAAYALTSLMLEQGREKIAYIGVTLEDKAAGFARKQGYLAALKKQGLCPIERYMTEGAFSIEAGYQNMKTILQRSSEIDAVFCATDFIAAGAMCFLKENKKRIPEDICLTGIGHTQMSSLITPSLTTAHYHYKTSGLEGANMLIEQINQPDLVHRELKLGYQIVLANSTPKQ